MKRNLKRLFFIAAVIVLIPAFTSCNLPFKIVPNVLTTTPPPIAATTPPPPSSLTEPAAATTEPPDQISLDDLVPVTGAVLRWIDLSDFVFVPEGEFSMGQASDTPSDHAPVHTVSLAGFWIHQGEVTNQQYAACVAAGACTAPSRETGFPYWYSQFSMANRPVVGVTWQQATEYCDYIHARLPSEAEWEKAARGSEINPYPWGEDDPDCSLLNFDDCLDPSEPEDIRSYPNGAGEFKTLDMSGNVFEWVNDWYDENYYTVSPASNPSGPAEGTRRVFRGGGYASPAEDVNVYTRFSAEPVEHSADLGFRCVLLGDYSSSGDNAGSQVPRPCSVLALNGQQPVEQPTWTPIPCEPASITSNCYLNAGGGPITSLTIYQANCQVNALDDFFSNTIQDLNCTIPPFDSSNDPKTYNCSGKNMIQGSTVDISFCHYYQMTQLMPECPLGYEFDPNTFFCEPSGLWLPKPPCPVYYIDMGNVCMPDASYYQGCPVGFYAEDQMISPTEMITVCIPLDECLYKKNVPPCNPPVCPAGQTYNQANNCCAQPKDLVQICVAGFMTQYNPVADALYCQQSHLFEIECEDRNVTIKYCPTLTPTPTSPPAGGNPGQNCYCDPKIISFCSWICN
mgnify:CR=1 FL=1